MSSQFRGGRARRRTLAVLLVILILLSGWYAFSPYRFVITVGASMSPALNPGQFFIIDRRAYRDGRTPAKNDVVVFRNGRSMLVKRVVGLPGDVLWLLRDPGSSKYGVIVPPDLAPVIQNSAEHFPALGRMVKTPVPAGRFFVAGDNRTDSIDSREFGPIGMDQIIGRVCFPRIGPLKENWSLSKIRRFKKHPPATDSRSR